MMEIVGVFAGVGPVEKFQPILINVWREVCRHIELGPAVRAITPMLLDDIPLQRLWIRRLTRDRTAIETLACAASDAELTLNLDRTPCTKPASEQLARWCSGGQVERLAVRAPRTDLTWAVPPRTAGDILIGPLATAEHEPGMLILASSPLATFDARHLELTRALLEPFSAALINDSRLRELASHRKAAEAEKQRLLARLGRADLRDLVVGESSGLQMVMQRVNLVAGSDVPVLIFGETGTGKELIARLIHHRSPRAAGPIIRVNCGAIPPELIDSELFGHQRGAFTGATETRHGWFERADGGTLFLDEIGELPPAAQVRLLRVLQDGWLERVGGGQPIHVDVRVVAATNRNLTEMVTGGSFRDDLWYRISVFTILLPPLRDRREDISALVAHFVERAARRFGLRAVSPSLQDLEQLMAYSWPGNVRELAAVIDRAAILGEGQRLDIAGALGIGASGATEQVASLPTTQQRSKGSSILPLDVIIRRHMEAALRAAMGRVEGPFGAAALLDINPHTLRARMRKLGIDWQQFRQS